MTDLFYEEDLEAHRAFVRAAEFVSIITRLKAQLATAESSIDDDVWYLAMHELREIAWEGKMLIAEKRMAEHNATRTPTPRRAAPPIHSAISDLLSLGISADEILATIKATQEQSK